MMNSNTGIEDPVRSKSYAEKATDIDMPLPIRTGFTRMMKKTYHDHHSANRILTLNSAAFLNSKGGSVKRTPSVLTTVTNATDDDSIAGATITRHPSPDRNSVGVMADLAEIEAQMLLGDSHTATSDKEYSPSPQLLLHDDAFLEHHTHHNGVDIGVGTSFCQCDYNHLVEVLSPDQNLMALMSSVSQGAQFADPHMIISPNLHSVESYFGSYSATPRHFKREDSTGVEVYDELGHYRSETGNILDGTTTPEVASLLLRQHTGAPCASVRSDNPVTDLTIRTEELVPYSPTAVSLRTSDLGTEPESTKTAISDGDSNVPSLGDTIVKGHDEGISAETKAATAAIPKAENGSALSVDAGYFDTTTAAPLPVAYYHHPEFFYTYLEDGFSNSDSQTCQVTNDDPIVVDNASRGWAVANLLTSYFPNPPQRSKSPTEPLIEAAHKVTDPKLVSFTQVVYAMALLKRLGAAEEKLKQKVQSTEEGHFFSSPPPSSSFFGPASARRALGAAILLAGKVHEDRYPRASAVASAVGLKMKKEADRSSATILLEAEQSSLEHLARTEAILLEKLQWSVHITAAEYAVVFQELMSSL